MSHVDIWGKAFQAKGEQTSALRHECACMERGWSGEKEGGIDEVRELMRDKQSQAL